VSKVDMCEVRSKGKTAKNQKIKSTVVSTKKKWTMMNPIWHRIKKVTPSSGQNSQLVHWWLLVHSGPVGPVLTRNTASPVGQTVVPVDSNRFYQGLFQSVTSFHSTVNSHFWTNMNLKKKKLEPRVNQRLTGSSSSVLVRTRTGSDF
jgi:hypothetical protein